MNMCFKCFIILFAFLFGNISFNPATARDKVGVALLGDSMTWIGGDSCQNDNGWSFHLKHSGITSTIDVYARSGATWTNTEHTRSDTAFYSEVLHDDNVIFNQALRLTERVKSGTSPAPDMIVIYAGANDAWFCDRRAEIFDETLYDEDSEKLPVTLAGSVRCVVRMLKEEFPDAAMVMVTPAEMTKTDVATVRRVGDIIETAAVDYGVAVVRADRDVPIRREDELKKFRYTKDGVHTNPVGARLLAECIIDALRQNLDARR